MITILTYLFYAFLFCLAVLYSFAALGFILTKVEDLIKRLK